MAHPVPSTTCPVTKREIDRLRYEARLAYLDGRAAYARYLNRRADRLARELREAADAA
jgi:hypothetical protein